MSDFGCPVATKVGTITIEGGDLYVHDDWEFENCSCRDAARLAKMHALEVISTCLLNDFWKNRPSSIMGTPESVLDRQEHENDC